MLNKEYVIAFKNTDLAIKAEQSLLQNKLQVGVMPLPPQISAGCGICLRVSKDDIKSALTALTDKSIAFNLFLRTDENGRYNYSEVKDINEFK